MTAGGAAGGRRLLERVASMYDRARVGWSRLSLFGRMAGGRLHQVLWGRPQVDAWYVVQYFDGAMPLVVTELDRMGYPVYQVGVFMLKPEEAANYVRTHYAAPVLGERGGAQPYAVVLDVSDPAAAPYHLRGPEPVDLRWVSQLLARLPGVGDPQAARAAAQMQPVFSIWDGQTLRKPPVKAVKVAYSPSPEVTRRIREAFGLREEASPTEELRRALARYVW